VPAAPIGQDSLLWKYASDVRSLMPGATAGLMQLMHPGIGAGVAEHSAFFDDPFDRIYRSVPQIWATILSADGDGRGPGIRDLHRRIGGVDEHGRRYHALEPETFWWAHATFTWEIFKAAELFHPEKLTADQHERLYAETVTWYSRYGVSMRPVPPDYGSFQSKFWHVCTRGLELTPAAARALDIARNGSASLSLVPVGPPMMDRAGRLVLERPLRIITFGRAPPAVRHPVARRRRGAVQGTGDGYPARLPRGARPAQPLDDAQHATVRGRADTGAALPARSLITRRRSAQVRAYSLVQG
jgi:uncharacterized protein (DUF2236 family)